jgi:hypothetical protein
MQVLVETSAEHFAHETAADSLLLFFFFLLFRRGGMTASRVKRPHSDLFASSSMLSEPRAYCLLSSLIVAMHDLMHTVGSAPFTP